MADITKVDLFSKLDIFCFLNNLSPLSILQGKVSFIEVLLNRRMEAFKQFKNLFALAPDTNNREEFLQACDILPNGVFFLSKRLKSFSLLISEMDRETRIEKLFEKLAQLPRFGIHRGLLRIEGVCLSSQELGDNKNAVFWFDVAILDIDGAMCNKLLEGLNIGDAIIFIRRRWFD